ncbi:MAG: hypothetical protein M1812_005129 [Candelaria pacifica]|nr:MAG: hypothetical protein M1812_005129 [Candelaria pacifica]
MMPFNGMPLITGFLDCQECGEVFADQSHRQSSSRRDGQTDINETGARYKKARRPLDAPRTPGPEAPHPSSSPWYSRLEDLSLLQAYTQSSLGRNTIGNPGPPRDPRNTHFNAHQRAAPLCPSYSASTTRSAPQESHYDNGSSHTDAAMLSSSPHFQHDSDLDCHSWKEVFADS